MAKPNTRQRSKAKPTTPARIAPIPKSPGGKNRKEDGGTSDASVASSTSSRPGLQGFVIKQLLRDIESDSFGGIVSLQKKGDTDHYLLATLLNARNEPNGDNKLYGRSASVKRRKIQKYVGRWRVYDRSKYLDLLTTYGVSAFSAAKKQSNKKQSIKSPAPKSEEGEDISDISEGSEELEVPGEIQTSKRTSKRTAQPKKPKKEVVSEVEEVPPTRAKKMSRASMDLPRDTRKSLWIQLWRWMILTLFSLPRPLKG